MASTIKLKNSTTAGNSPSSLSQGEVAINVADGGLFYGTTGGTSVSSSLLISHLTASSNISASGTITGLSGSFENITTTDITVNDDIVLNNNSRIVAKNNPTQTFIELQNDDGFKLEANNTPVFSAFSNGIVFNEDGTTTIVTGKQKFELDYF